MNAAAQPDSAARAAALAALTDGTPASIPAGERALFTELTQGTQREWHFLESIVARHAKKTPRGKLQALVHLALYQLLFLDGIPTYAVYATTKELGSAERLSSQELAFAHSVLKAAEAEKDQLLENRHQVLIDAAEGFIKKKAPKPEVLQAVLNLPQDVLSEVADSAKLQGGGKATRAWQALSALKHRPRLVGYVLPEALWQGDEGAWDDEVKVRPLGSKLAPDAIVFENGETLQWMVGSGRAWVQGEASQWASFEAAKLLAKAAEHHKAGEPIKVMEMAAGKGGKSLRTACELWLRHRDLVERLQWVASDISPEQMALFEKDVSLRMAGVGISCETRIWDWTRTDGDDTDAAAYDLVWIDAPCTGIGTIAKHPEIARRVDAKAVKDLSDIQLKMLRSAARLVRPGGYIDYCVCTLTKSETFGVVDAFLAENPGFKLVSKTMLWPGGHSEGNAPVTAEGFFAAVFEAPSPGA